MGHKHSHGPGYGQGHRHAALSGTASPLVRGLGFRLGWAGGFSVLLWFGVVWALQ
jgi:hypothetical protein